MPVPSPKGVVSRQSLAGGGDLTRERNKEAPAANKPVEMEDNKAAMVGKKRSKEEIGRAHV